MKRLIVLLLLAFPALAFCQWSEVWNVNPTTPFIAAEKAGNPGKGYTQSRRFPTNTIITSVAKSGSNYILTWSAPTVDQLGNAITPSSYLVYRGLLHAPFRAMKLLSTVNAPTVTYTDTTASTAINGQAASYFWIVYAVSDHNVAEYWRQVPGNKSIKVQWPITGFVATDSWSVGIKRRDLDGVIYPVDYASGQALADVAEFPGLGGASVDWPLVFTYSRNQYADTVSHTGTYASTGYTLADDSDGAVNAVDGATVAGVPVITAVKASNTVSLTWSAATGAVSSYLVYRSLYHAGETGAVLLTTTSSTSFDDSISGLSTNEYAVYTLKILYTDGTYSEHSANSNIIRK